MTSNKKKHKRIGPKIKHVLRMTIQMWQSINIDQWVFRFIQFSGKKQRSSVDGEILPGNKWKKREEKMSKFTLVVFHLLYWLNVAMFYVCVKS